MSLSVRSCIGVLTLFAGAGFGCASEVPSQQEVVLQEVLVDQVDTGTWLRFRFVAPRIARKTGDITYAEAATDMEHLCKTVAISYMKDHEMSADKVVISLSDQETEFGVPNPDATQFFDLFDVENETCTWEAF